VHIEQVIRVMHNNNLEVLPLLETVRLLLYPDVILLHADMVVVLGHFPLRPYLARLLAGILEMIAVVVGHSHRVTELAVKPHLATELAVQPHHAEHLYWSLEAAE